MEVILFYYGYTMNTGRDFNFHHLERQNDGGRIQLYFIEFPILVELK